MGRNCAEATKATLSLRLSGVGASALAAGFFVEAVWAVFDEAACAAVWLVLCFVDTFFLAAVEDVVVCPDATPASTASATNTLKRSTIITLNLY